jgi:phytol kinase
VTAAFPLLLWHTESVAVLCGGFALGLGLLHARGHLASLHAVGRRSCGDVALPLAAAACFALTRGRPAVHVAALLVLAVSDALAAGVGQLAGRCRYRVLGSVRSLEGSAAFTVSAFPVIALALACGEGRGLLDVAWRAAGAALLASGLEALTPFGLDNLSVPLGVVAALLAFESPAAGRFVEALWLLAGLAVGFALGRARLGALRHSWERAAAALRQPAWS